MDKDEAIPRLKTCPFCGDLPQVVFSGTFRVQCSDCGALGPPFPSSPGAAKRWNRRGSDPNNDDFS
jgi:Lar family restriction alleviation protein